MKLEDKINIAEDILKDRKVAIGFSSGADSTLLAYLSSKVSKDTLLITIDNHLMPEGFIENTVRFSESLGMKHEIIDIDFYMDDDFLANDSKRCYNCRELMYSNIEKVAHENGFDFICDGNNISDLVSDRPGILITYKKGFKTPLIDAKLTSKEIHEYLDKNNITYSKSTTCLATRIPTNTPTTEEKIRRIGYCENYILDNTDCEIVKVRDFEELAVIEVDKVDEISGENIFNQISDELKHQGFVKVELNSSPIDDNDYISIDYCDGSFSYQLPFTINIKNTKKQLTNETAESSHCKIKLDNITVYESGLITGEDFKTYDCALYRFMDVLTKLRRNV